MTRRRIVFATALLAFALCSAPARADAPAQAQTAPALAGKWHLRLHVLARVNLAHTGQARKTWIFRRAGGQTQLLSQLAAGGYERFSLHRRDTTTWVGQKHGLGVYCRRLGRYVGQGEQSVSIHITTSALVNGVLTATALEGYYRESYRSNCGGQSLLASGKYRLNGNRVDLDG